MCSLLIGIDFVAKHNIDNAIESESNDASLVVDDVECSTKRCAIIARNNDVSHRPDVDVYFDNDLILL